MSKGGEQQHRKKIKKVFKNPLTSQTKGAIIKAQLRKSPTRAERGVYYDEEYEERDVRTD